MLRWALLLVVASGACACAKSPALPSYGRVPEFAFQDQHGQAASRALLLGKVSIANFMFTSCPDVCPLLTEQLAGVRKQLPQGAALGFVSFSVDPEHDTPAKLQAFAAAHGADQADWHFLTGPIDEVRRVVVTGFKQAMQAQPEAPGRPRNVLHGTHFVLVDRSATIRGFYRTDAEGLSQLRTDTQRLLQEPSSP